MRASVYDASAAVTKPRRKRGLPMRRLVSLPVGADSGAAAQYSFVDLGDSARVPLVLTPRGRGSFGEQALEVLSALQAVLRRQPVPMVVTCHTVFLRDGRDQAACEQLFARHYGAELPVISYVLQPPCEGAALALEAWAIGGATVRVERHGPHALAVSYDGVRWLHCGGVQAVGSLDAAYPQTLDVLARLHGVLERAGSGLDHVVRTWFYLGGITEPEGGVCRYQELNRARADFYREIDFCSALLEPHGPPRVYPASTGIGMAGTGLVMSCLALETDRADVRLLPLENPQQTPAYAYDPKYSSQSPKFSRAMALVLGDYVTTWISGTASIVNSESCHLGDIEKQTEQTIDNIERLIGPENFGAHGVQDAGASLADVARVRIYLKRPEDLARCQAVCRRRFGAVPAVYAVADVCRPELLVEIEGVAFSRCLPAPGPARPVDLKQSP